MATKQALYFHLFAHDWRAHYAKPPSCCLLGFLCEKKQLEQRYVLMCVCVCVPHMCMLHNCAWYTQIGWDDGWLAALPAISLSKDTLGKSGREESPLKKSKTKSDLPMMKNL